MEYYYDGLNFLKYYLDDRISGFTTNCSLCSTSKEYSSYLDIFIKNKDKIGNRPFSFQIWEDNLDLCISQVNLINSINNNIYIKIPIINSFGIYNNEIINYSKSINLNLNITAIHTTEQIDKTYELINDYNKNCIISIFAGPISDTGICPEPIVEYAIKLFKNKINCKILWAGCREVYSVIRAKNIGCHIITIPDIIIDKVLNMKKSLEEASLERVLKFKSDAVNNNLLII